MHTDQIGWAILYNQLRLIAMIFRGGVNLYACDFFLIITQPKCRHREGRVWVFSGKGDGRKRGQES